MSLAQTKHFRDDNLKQSETVKKEERTMRKVTSEEIKIMTEQNKRTNTRTAGEKQALQSYKRKGL